jgi:beta-phosphoglucomutase family hydrolase
MDHAIGRIEAVIFDLDGTLVDSEPLYYEADKKVLGRFGIEMNMQMKNKYVGISSKKMMEDMKALHHLTESVEELLHQKNAGYLELAQYRTTVFPEMLKFVKWLQEQDFPMAVASGSSVDVIDMVLEVAALRKYFAVVVSSDQVKHSKPAPDVFLEAARRLNVAPERCLVLEDSRYGVEAARKAHMHCMAMPYPNGMPMHECFNTADLLFEKGMEEFTATTAMNWLLASQA